MTNIKFYKQLIDNMNDLVQSVDPDGKIIYVNKEWQKIMGYSAKEALGMPFSKIIHKDHFGQCRKVFDELQKGKKKRTLETVFITKKGDEILFEGNLNTISEGGKISATIGVFRNITERKKIENELRKNRIRLKDILMNIADWVWEVDSQGRYVYTSDKVKDILGYSPEEIIGKTPFDFMSDREKKRIGKVFEKIIGDRKPIVDLVNWNITKKGKEICLLTNGVPIFDDNGLMVGYRGVDKDITKREKTEKETKEHTEELERMNDVMVGREIKMAELKEEIKKLKIKNK